MKGAVAKRRRSFAWAKDARRGTYVVSEGRLLEVVAVRGDPFRPDGRAAVLLLDCAAALPARAAEEYAAAEWRTLDDVRGMWVVPRPAE